MIITPPANAGDIIVLKLITSEELITKVVEINQDHIKISKPIVLSIAGNPLSKESGLVPMPWSITIDENVNLEIKRDKIIFIAKPRKEIINMYLQITSNIVLPKEGILK